MIFRGWIKFKIYQKLEIETLEIPFFTFRLPGAGNFKNQGATPKNPGSRATLLATALTSIIFLQKNQLA